MSRATVEPGSGVSAQSARVLTVLILGTGLLTAAYLALVAAEESVPLWTLASIALAAALGFGLGWRVGPPERDRSDSRSDPLTGLANLGALEESLGSAISRSLRTDRRIALLVFDLDNFNFINATYGQRAGDAVLETVARRLRRHVRSIDALGRFQSGDFESPSRLGGDEFAVLLTEVTKLVGVATAAQRLAGLIEEPMAVGGARLTVRATVGIAVFPDEAGGTLKADVGAVRERLLLHAVRALYSAKRAGEAFQFHDPEMDRRIGTRLALGQALGGALDRNELFLEYQPQIELDGRTVVGVEALLRWRHPRRGVVGPAEFIPILEGTGQIKEVGDWVLRTACRTARRWSGLRPDGVSLAVNVSAVQFRDPLAIERLLEILAEEEVAPGLVDLEITESVLLKATPEVEESLARLHDQAGVRLTLDDFGRGYSSLEYLRRFPIDTVKVDRSFVGSMEGDPDSAAIVSAVLALANRLNLRVVAEGVETAAQLEMLAGEGCSCAQGYYFSRPVAPEQVAELLSRGGEHIRPAEVAEALEVAPGPGA